MQRTAFSRPFTVLVGMGFPFKVCDLMDAVRLLDEQPSGMRDEAFHAAYGACRNALKGEVPADDARDVICAFARRRRLLIEEFPCDPARVSPEAASRDIEFVPVETRIPGIMPDKRGVGWKVEELRQRGHLVSSERVMLPEAALSTKREVLQGL